VQEKGSVLIVDDEKDMRWLISNILRLRGFSSLQAEDADSALKTLESAMPDVILLDIKMPGPSGLELLETLRKREIRPPVIMITAYGEVKSAVKSLKLGAYDYIIKPFENDELLAAVERAYERNSLSREVKYLRDQLKGKASLINVMGPSEAVGRIVDQINRVAITDFTIILQGETGTGKEFIARAIHMLSPRRKGPFIAIDCGSLPENLIESELFGHEKGAFTGASEKKSGLFEIARGGTFFLDEIGNLPVAFQHKLLRVLEERKIRRVGGKETIQVDVRIIAASNVNLEQEVEAGRFRKDLYFRLNEFTISVPPLRERKEDLEFLAELFVEEAAQELDKKIERISADGMDVLLRHHWPGNIRELRNRVRRAALICDGNIIESSHLSLSNGEKGNGSWELLSPEKAFTLIEKGMSLGQVLQAVVEEIEHSLIRKALKKAENNKMKTSQILKIDYKTLYRKLHKYDL
jgi:DNA-binding NtrC family response regulator